MCIGSRLDVNAVCEDGFELLIEDQLVGASEADADLVFMRLHG